MTVAIAAEISTPFEEFVRLLLIFKVVLFTVLVPGTVTLYVPYLLLSRSNVGLSPVSLVSAVPAAIAMIAGAAIYLRCAWDFAVDGLGTPAPIDPPKRLVVSGLYRRTRNPMYLGVLLMLLGECGMFAEFDLGVYAGVVALLFHVFVVFYEEPILAARFGQSYRDYCAAVPRWTWALQSYCAADR